MYSETINRVSYDQSIVKILVIQHNNQLIVNWRIQTPKNDNLFSYSLKFKFSLHILILCFSAKTFIGRN